MRSKIAIALVAFMLPIGGAKADIASDLDNFWGSLSGTSNLTGATAFEGQAAGYYTLGNLRARAQSRSSSLTSFSLPSVEAGCGGIDLFAGSFSIISADEIVQLSRAIASNAVGFAFDLALETVSPVISETMKNLRAQLQELNLNNINSCEAAKGIVSAVWPKQAFARDKICAELGSSKGIFSDYASSRHECGRDGGRQQANAAADPNEINTFPDKINIAWELSRGKNFASADWLKSDKELAEFVMTMTGTVIKNGDDLKFYEPQALLETENKKTYFHFITHGGSANEFTFYTCGNADKCLTISEQNKTLAADKTLRARVAAMVNDPTNGLIAKIKNNQALTPQQLGFVNATQLPIYRFLNVYAAYSGPIITTEIDTLIDVLTIELATEWVEGLILQMIARAGVSELSGDPMVEAWIENLRALSVSIYEISQKNQAKFNRALVLSERVRTIETILSKNLANNIGQLINVNAAPVGN